MRPVSFSSLWSLAEDCSLGTASEKTAHRGGRGRQQWKVAAGHEVQIS